MKKKTIILFLLLSGIHVFGQIHNPVKWTIVLNDLPSAEKEVVFKATIEKGWRVYDMNLPDNGPIPLSIHFEELQGVELLNKPVASVKPEEKFDKIFDMTVRWFANEVAFTQKIKVVDFRKFKLSGQLQFMVCNDETCLAPVQIPFLFNRKDISIVPDGNRSETVESAESVTSDLPAVESNRDDSSTSVLIKPLPSLKIPVKSSDALVKPSMTEKEERDLWMPVIDELKALGDATSATADRAYIYLFIAGFIGGLLALLTPCVWPMIPLTVSFFLKRAKNRKKAISDALLYGFSIIAIYLAMGLVITAIFGASALNDLSTNAIFNILFFLLLLVFAVSFFGAFDMVLPSSWTTKMDSKAESTSGLISIFFMSFTLVLVSFSCTGPIIGTLLVEAASQGKAIGPAIGMFGFAFALAIPFAVFALFPNMLQSIPKSGGWLNVVKVVLGFLELALALKFLSVADLAYGWRLLDREVFLTLWIVIFALLGLYFIGKIRFRYDSELKQVSVPRLFLAILSFAFAVYMVPGLWGAPLKAISAFAPPLYTQDFNLFDDEVHAQFDDYDKGMAFARQVGKPVLIDFSGFGCVNCRKMEAAVWTHPRVKQLIDNDFILITLFVDDKTKLPQTMEVEENGKSRTLKTIGEKWSYLQRSKFGANAQPFYVILDNNGSPLSPSYAYDESVPKFIRFLEAGKNN